MNIAVRALGYTHTEAGWRTPSQLALEVDDICRAQKQKSDDAGIFDGEEETAE